MGNKSKIKLNSNLNCKQCVYQKSSPCRICNFFNKEFIEPNDLTIRNGAVHSFINSISTNKRGWYDI